VLDGAQRLADGWPVDPESLGEVALVRQAGSMRDLACEVFVPSSRVVRRGLRSQPCEIYRWLDHRARPVVLGRRLGALESKRDGDGRPAGAVADRRVILAMSVERDESGIHYEPNEGPLTSAGWDRSP
jgi:hypothetical protein